MSYTDDIRTHGDETQGPAGYRYCGCSTCFELTIGSPGVWCDDCIEADCGDECEVLHMSED